MPCAPIAVAYGLRARRPTARRGAGGFTLIETSVALAVLAIGALAVLGTMVYSLQLDAMNRETTVATQAARRVVEEIRASDLRDVPRLYNADATDDPDGPGTAPGDVFSVTLLEKVIGNSENCGSVVLPFDGDGVIRETANIPELGFPRDLNGDDVLDSDDRSADLLALPVIVRVRWRGTTGDRVVSYETTLR